MKVTWLNGSMKQTPLTHTNAPREGARSKERSGGQVNEGGGTGSQSVTRKGSEARDGENIGNGYP